MNLCSGCLVKAELKVLHPQLVSKFYFCDGCKKAKSSYSVVEIVEQIYKENT